jgi:hypothetical protein
MRLFLYEISGWLGYLARPQVLIQVLVGMALYASYSIWIRPRLLAVATGLSSSAASGC